MSKPSLLLSRVWIAVLLVCSGFLLWSYSAQIKRARYVTSIGQDELPTAATGLTGYVGGARQLIIPEHIDDSFEWIAQTQQMFARGELRVRQIDYENAPFGRAVHSASPYRWWLGVVAWVDHAVSGRPLGLSVERAALLADPLIHVLLLLATTIFVARYFGSTAGSIAAVFMVAVYPLSAGFVPAVPDDFALILALTPWCVLPLILGFRALTARSGGESDGLNQRRARSWFMVAGVAGGLGMWIGLEVQLPLLLGIGIGALFAAWALRPGKQSSIEIVNTPPWRCWAVSGASTILVGYLVEYFPAYLGEWELRAIHPIYGVAWLGGGEVLTVATALIQRSKTKWSIRDVVRLLVGVAALSSLPAAMWKTSNPGFLGVDLLSFRLTKQIDAVLAPNLSQWLVREGMSAAAWATLLPTLAFGFLFWQGMRRRTGEANRAALAVLLGPAFIALVLAYFHLRWWQIFDGLMLIAVVYGTFLFAGPGAPALRRWLWFGYVACAFVFGLFQLSPLKGTGAKNVLSLAEVEGLVERDLSHWLAKHSTPGEPAIVLAPPSLTKTLAYYGGMPGLASLSWENKDGLSVALRIVISTSREEALALLRRREVNYIVIPSWDTFFEEYTRSASVQVGELFLTGLHRWALPLWLRPIPYELPKIAGFDQHSVVIFEVVDEQNEPVALSRLAEYFLEMDQMDRAQATAQALRRFPVDFGALVTRAQVEAALRNTPAFTALMETLVKRLSAGGDRNLPWDRRVSLAVALARAQRVELSRAQVQRCLAEIDEARIRSLTTYSLFHLDYLRKGFGLEIKDPRLRQLVAELLPVEQAGAPQNQ